MAGRRIHIVMDEGLVGRIDAALPVGVPRSVFVRGAVERALEAEADTSSKAVAVEIGRPSSAPAEQPRRTARDVSQPGPDVTRYRSSLQARGDVRPIPKGGRVTQK